jgi:membrane carboxypeptidase/penicillin-binding protein PbpC
VPLRVALASSYNVPAVRTLEEIGIDALLEAARRFGLTTLSDTEAYGLALTLGGGEVRPLDLTAAYGALTNQGLLSQPFAVRRVRDASGRVLFDRDAPAPSRAVLPEIAFIIADILSDPEARLPGFGPTNPLTLSVPAAVKTGTTTGFRDNWTVGATPERAVGVWVGNTDNRPMGNVSGVDGAGPIWRGVMELALQGMQPTWLQPPAGLVRARICAPTGLRPGPYCPASVEEWFVAGTEPRETERYYLVGADGRLRVDPPVEVRAWAAQAGISVSLSPQTPGDASVHIVRPTAGSVFSISPELPDQEIVLRASVPAGTLRVEFWVDGVLVGRAAGDEPAVVWVMMPGVHSLEVVAVLADGALATTSTTFEVRYR